LTSIEKFNLFKSGVDVRSNPAGEGRRLTYFTLSDNSSVTLFRTEDRATLLWPISLTAKAFIEKTTKALSLDTPAVVEVLGYNDEKKSVKIEDLPSGTKGTSSIEIIVPERGLRILWYSHSFSPNNPPEGGIDLPDFSDVSLLALMSASGTGNLQKNKEDLVLKIRSEMQSPLVQLD
jgi:hypothetical protein